LIPATKPALSPSSFTLFSNALYSLTKAKSCLDI
jgi:hypothetical protein